MCSRSSSSGVEAGAGTGEKDEKGRGRRRVEGGVTGMLGKGRRIRLALGISFRMSGNKYPRSALFVSYFVVFLLFGLLRFVGVTYSTYAFFVAPGCSLSCLPCCHMHVYYCLTMYNHNGDGRWMLLLSYLGLIVNFFPTSILTLLSRPGHIISST